MVTKAPGKKKIIRVGFIVDCPDLQKEKSKDKSKKSTFKSNKIKKQIK